jgi:hypothetical protein
MKLIINTTKQNGNVKIQNCNLGYINKRAVILKKKRENRYSVDSPIHFSQLAQGIDTFE